MSIRIPIKLLPSPGESHGRKFKIYCGRPHERLKFSARLAYQLARQTGFVELPVTAELAAQKQHLPWHHRNPFDRLLIAQAKLLTADAQCRTHLA